MAKFIFPVIIAVWVYDNIGPWWKNGLFGFLFNLGILSLLYFALKGCVFKVVHTDGENFYISNFFREVVVPCDLLDDVVCRSNGRGMTVALVFSAETPFGDEVIFLPRSLGGEEVVSQVRRYLKSEKQ